MRPQKYRAEEWLSNLYLPGSRSLAAGKVVGILQVAAGKVVDILQVAAGKAVGILVVVVDNMVVVPDILVAEDLAGQAERVAGPTGIPFSWNSLLFMNNF